MKKTMLVIGFLLMVVMLGGWSHLPHAPILMPTNAVEQLAPAAAGDPELSVNNLTGAAFYMTLTGPQTYSVHVLPGKNTFVVAKGEYIMSYFACGAQQTKEVNVKKGGASIKLTCDKPKTGKTPKLSVDNKTGPVYLNLTGPKSYSFLAPTGKTDFELEQGTYEITYFACGAQITDTILVKKKGASLKILCVTITVYNFTDGPVELEFSGPADYYFYLQTGKTVITLAAGNYDITITTPCWAVSGSINIKKNDGWGIYCK